MQSVSRIPIHLSINEKGAFDGELIRFLSPFTIKKISESLPISERINKFQNKYIYLKVEIGLGYEKPTKNFQKGDIAFSPISNSICIFLEDVTNFQQLNPVGVIISGDLKYLSNTKPGDILTIRKD